MGWWGLYRLSADRLPRALCRYAGSPKVKGERRFRCPGSRRRRGFAPGRLRFRPQSGLVQREFYSIAAAESGILESKRGGRPPLAGRGSALRFRAGRGLCRRVVKAMTAGKNYPVTLTSYSSPEGRYHHPRPKGPSPPSTQPAAAGGHNLQPRRGWPPSPLNLLNPLNPLNPLNLHSAAALCLIPYGPLLPGRRGA